MTRPATVKPEKRIANQREKAIVKKEKFEPLTGWQLPSSSTIIGLEAWIKRKESPANVEFSKKKQQQEDQHNPWEAFLCYTKYRCSEIEDLPLFEDESLVPSLRPRNYVPLKNETVDEKDETADEKAEETVESDKGALELAGGTTGDESQRVKRPSSERAKTDCVQGTQKEQGGPRSKSAGNAANNKAPLTALSPDGHMGKNETFSTEKDHKEENHTLWAYCDDEGQDQNDASAPDGQVDPVDRKNAKDPPTVVVTSKKPINQRKSQLFNTVESIGRLLKKNPVRLSYTRTNFLLKQRSGYWNVPSGKESVSGTSNTATDQASDARGVNDITSSPAETSVNGAMSDSSSESSEVLSRSEIPEFDLTGKNSNPLLHPNDCRTFGHFERTHTTSRDTQSAHTMKKHFKELHKVQSAPEILKSDYKKPQPSALNKSSIQDLNETDSLSHQAAISAVLASRIRDISQVNESIAHMYSPATDAPQTSSSTRVHSPEDEHVDTTSLGGQLNFASRSNTFMKQAPVFNIGDILPAVDRNISVSVQKNSRLFRNSHESKDLEKAISYGLPGKDSLLPYEDSFLMVKEGVDLARLKERNQMFLGPPAFQPRTFKSPLQRGRDITQKMPYNRYCNQQLHTRESESNSARGGGGNAKPGSAASAPTLRHSEPNGFYHHNSNLVKSSVKLSRPRITAHLISQLRKRPTSNPYRESEPAANEGQ